MHLIRTDLKGEYWTPLRVDLVAWFDDHASSFSAGYIAAVELLQSPSFPARVHFICHAIRDVYRLLPPALGADPLPTPTQVFPNMVKSLVEKWDRHPSPETSTAGTFSVSPQVYRYIKKIVGKSESMAQQKTVGQALAVALFRSHDQREVEFIHPWIMESFDREYDFFVKRAHFAQSTEKVPDDDGLKEHFVAFERAFHSLVGPYFSGKEELDAILQDTNKESG